MLLDLIDWKLFQPYSVPGVTTGINGSTKKNMDRNTLYYHWIMFLKHHFIFLNITISLICTIFAIDTNRHKPEREQNRTEQNRPKWDVEMKLTWEFHKLFSYLLFLSDPCFPYISIVSVILFFYCFTFTSEMKLK